MYDVANNRYIAIAIQFIYLPNRNVHNLEIATTTDPSGAWKHCTVNVGSPQFEFWDQPRLGQTNNAILITGDIFNTDQNGNSVNNMIDGRAFAVPKANLYAGQGCTVRFYRH